MCDIMCAVAVAVAVACFRICCGEGSNLRVRVRVRVCACAVSGDCSNGLVCNSNVVTPDGLLSFLSDNNVFGQPSDANSCGGGLGVLQKLQTLAQELFGVPVVRNPAGFGVCLPTSDSWANFQTSFTNAVDTVDELATHPGLYECVNKYVQSLYGTPSPCLCRVCVVFVSCLCRVCVCLYVCVCGRECLCMYVCGRGCMCVFIS